MKPTWRQSQEPQERPQREVLAGPIHGAPDSYLGASVWQTFSCEPKPGGSEQNQRKPEQRRELQRASPQLQDFLSELRLREVRYIQTDHDGRRRAQPSTGRRARDAEVRGDGHVAGAGGERWKSGGVA